MCANDTQRARHTDDAHHENGHGADADFDLALTCVTVHESAPF